MELKKLVDECIEALQESAYGEYMPDDYPKNFGATVNTNDGYIDLWMTRCKNGDYAAEVNVCHDDESKNTDERHAKNLEEFLAKELDDCIDWDALEERYQDDTEDEWQAHGFRDAADYWGWKEGR